MDHYAVPISMSTLSIYGNPISLCNQYFCLMNIENFKTIQCVLPRFRLREPPNLICFVSDVYVPREILIELLICLKIRGLYISGFLI